MPGVAGPVAGLSRAKQANAARSESRYGDRVNDESVTISLTPDRAFVLSDWLYEVMMRSS